jgi:hypothetical protein
MDSDDDDQQEIEEITLDSRITTIFADKSHMFVAEGDVIVCKTISIRSIPSQELFRIPLDRLGINNVQRGISGVKGRAADRPPSGDELHLERSVDLFETPTGSTFARYHFNCKEHPEFWLGFSLQHY